MKKILFAGAAVVSMLVSCNDKSASGTDNAAFTKAKADNAEIYKAMETGDVSKLKDYIAADAVDHNGNMDNSDIKGADSIMAMLGKMHTCFEPGAKFTITSQAMDGDMLYTMSDFSGKTTAAPQMGLPPSTQMNWKNVDVTKIKDGKAVEHWGFMSMKDVNEMAAMMMKSQGAVPPASDKVSVDTATAQ